MSHCSIGLSGEMHINVYVKAYRKLLDRFQYVVYIR